MPLTHTRTHVHAPLIIFRLLGRPLSWSLGATTSNMSDKGINSARNLCYGVTPKHSPSRLVLICVEMKRIGVLSNEPKSGCVSLTPIEHSENKISCISKTRLDLECSSRVLNKHTSFENAKQLKENQNTFNDLSLCI